VDEESLYLRGAGILPKPSQLLFFIQDSSGLCRILRFGG
jgi:hypothetical protein